MVVLNGTGRGQWRRVVGVGGPRNRTITLDFPFDPPLAASTAAASEATEGADDAGAAADTRVQIGPFRGQVMLVGNRYERAFGGMQLYAVRSFVRSLVGSLVRWLVRSFDLVGRRLRWQRHKIKSNDAPCRIQTGVTGDHYD